MSKCYTLTDIEQGCVFDSSRWTLIARDQYIGLADKHDKDIYEGDILAHDKAVTIGQVICEYGGYVIQADNSWRIPTDTEKYDEIIGDIYSNPELLVDRPEIDVQPPNKQVIASMEVELSSKDFKRRLPTPVISKVRE